MFLKMPFWIKVLFFTLLLIVLIGLPLVLLEMVPKRWQVVTQLSGAAITFIGFHYSRQKTFTTRQL